MDEHKGDFKSGKFSDGLVFHIISTNRTFDFQHSNSIALTHNKNKRRIIESSAISYYNSTQQRPGFYKISPYLPKIMLKDFNSHKQRWLNRYFYPPSKNTDSICPQYFSVPSRYFFSLPFHSSFFLPSYPYFFFLSYQYEPTFYRICASP